MYPVTAMLILNSTKSVSTYRCLFFIEKETRKQRFVKERHSSSQLRAQWFVRKWREKKAQQSRLWVKDIEWRCGLTHTCCRGMPAKRTASCFRPSHLEMVGGHRDLKVGQDAPLEMMTTSQQGWILNEMSSVKHHWWWGKVMRPAGFPNSSKRLNKWKQRPR